MPEPTLRVLVTGADGSVGRHLVQHLLASSEEPLLLWTRARDTHEALARMRGVVRAAHLVSGRVRLVAGDLRDRAPFRAVDPREVGAVIHLAAVTSFAVSAEEADAVNRDGTAKVLGLAARCPSLRSFCLAGTVYASGLRAGPVAEEPLDDSAGFANHYERSKWEAEQLVLRAGLGVPTAVVRLATVLADDASGRFSDRTAVHNTLDLLRRGLLPLMPGDPDVPVYVVTGELAARSLAEALAQRAQGVLHAAHRPEHSLTLREALDIALQTFDSRRPPFADLTSFGLLARGVDSFGGGVLGQALGSLLPFARQLYVGKQVDNTRLRGLLPDYRPDDAAALFRATCEALAAGRTAGRVPA
jgi:nucleoside-diphosphate-sugar epimerase